MIATFVQEDHRDWDQHLHEFRHAINTATQATTKVSSAFLNYERDPRPVRSLRRKVEAKELVQRTDPQNWVDRLKRLDTLRDLVAHHIDESQEKQSRLYNRGRKAVTFQVGDLVMRRLHVLSNAVQRFSAKLAPKYDGPHRIVEVRSQTVYVLDMKSGKRNAKVHVCELKRYIPPRTGNPK